MCNKKRIIKPTTFVIIIAVVLSFGCNVYKKNKNSNSAPNFQNYRGPIIDMHIHAYSEGHPLFGMTCPPTLRGKTYKAVKSSGEQKEKTLEKFRKYNIIKAMVTNGDLWDDKNEGSILIGRADKNLEVLRNLYQKNRLQVIAEMAPFYAGMQANDTSMMPYFELAQSLAIPVGFHIFPGGPNNGIHLLPEMLGRMRAKNANPLQLEDVLVKFKKIKLYIMHGGWPYTEEVKALMYMHPNVYVDISVLNWLLPQQEFENYLKALIDAGFENRILFGTDQMVWPDTIDDAVESVNSASFLTLKQKEDIFYNNAATFLGLTDKEIQKHKRK